MENVGLPLNILFKSFWILDSLGNVNRFSKGNNDENAGLPVLGMEYSQSKQRKYFERNS